MGKNKQNRSWVFTLNNYLPADEKSILEWQVNKLTVGREVGESGTKHLQGAVSFKLKKSLSQLKKLLPKAHWEVLKGGKKAYEYCRKDGDLLVDIKGRQGHRTDIDALMQDIKDGASDKELWTKHPALMLKNNQGVARARNIFHPQITKSDYKISDFLWGRLPLDKPTIIWGEPGIGKTQYALAHFEKPLLVSHMDDLGNLTEDHDGIVFDDMSFNHMPRTGQIHLVDNLTRSIHIRYKTATIPAGIKRIFTTNEKDGAIMLTQDGAIRRRIEIHHLLKLPDV